MNKKLNKLKRYLSNINLKKEAAEVKELIELISRPGAFEILKENDTTAIQKAEKEVEDHLLKNNPIMMLELLTPDEDFRIPFNPQLIHTKNNTPLNNPYPIDSITYFIGRNPKIAIINQIKNKKQGRLEYLMEDDIISQLVSANNRQIISTDTSTDDLQIIVTVTSPNTIILRQPRNATMETIVRPGRRAILPISEVFKNREELVLGNTGTSVKAKRGSDLGINPGIIRQAKKKIGKS